MDETHVKRSKDSLPPINTPRHPTHFYLLFGRHFFLHFMFRILSRNE